MAATGEEILALELLAQATELWPENAKAVLLAAEVSSSLKRYSEAVAWANRLPKCSDQMQLRAALLRANVLSRELFDLSAAEHAWKDALAIHPDNVEACTGLAKLLATCARPVEASPYILKLIRLGVATDLLIILSREQSVIRDIDLLKAARAAAPDDPNPLTGLAWHRSEAGETEAAIELLREAIRLDPDAHAAQAALGTLLYSASRWKELATWLRTQPADLERFFAVWLVRGQLAERFDRAETAIRCYLEAAQRRPDSKLASSRLSILLAQIGQHDAAEGFAQASIETHRLQDLQGRVLFSDGEPPLEAFLDLIDAFERQGRTHEACGWCRMCVQEFPTSRHAVSRLQELERQLRAVPDSTQFDPGGFLDTFNFAQYPLPNLQELSDSLITGSDHQTVQRDSESERAVSFRNDANSTGLRFRFFNGTDGPLTRRIYELTGGGVGILDFDADGCQDVFLTQGCRWPPSLEPSPHSDRLFRNASCSRFVDASADARITDDAFGQGVAVGDVNSDGFSDVYVANIGRNKLWINLGDGTFTPSAPMTSPADQWTTSCALVDLNGDTYPDLFDVNYLSGDDLFDRICRDGESRPRQCSPMEFEGSADRVLLNSRHGGFSSVSPDAVSSRFIGKGLGIAVWYRPGSSQPRILVANDTVPNQLLVPRPKTSREPQFEDIGFQSGIGLNEDGRPEGSMGIAVADLNADGLPEFHITNFYNESSTLFWQTAPGFFEDRTRTTHLHAPSLRVLGFGTQFLDADLDGLPELFVANGHVDDLRESGRPYRMSPQLFRWDGVGFELSIPTTIGPYFERRWLGRAAATIDWNNDGRTDLIVGHLDDEYALLTNVSPDPGRSLSIRLIGAESNRDAIGASVLVRTETRTSATQITAGNGYHACNERRVTIGLGQRERADTVEVTWPSGRRQQFNNVPASRRYVIVEGAPLLDEPVTPQ